MEECVECAKEFGRRAAVELNIPIYLYEEAQTQTYRKGLPQIREGEYEGISKKIIYLSGLQISDLQLLFLNGELQLPEPRFFLVAYNVNILCNQ